MAIGFDGVDDYLSYPDDASLNPGSGAFTLLCRAWFEANATGTHLIIVKGNSSGGTGGGKRYQLFQRSIGGFNDLRFEVDDGTPKNEVTGSITQGRWESIVAVVPASGSIELFVNGVSQGTVTRTVADIDQTETLKFGAGPTSGDTATNFWQGRLADVTFVKRALSAGERAAYEAGYSGLFFRPDFHAPLIRARGDVIGGLSVTSTGAPSVEDHPPLLMPAQLSLGVPAAATSRTTTASLAAALQAQQDVATSLASALQRPQVSLASVDAGLQALKIATLDLSSALAEGRGGQAAFDAALQRFGNVLADIDAALRREIAATASLDARLTDGLQATLALTAALRRLILVQGSLDAALAALMAVQSGADAALRHSRIQAGAADAALLGDFASSADVDAALRRDQARTGVTDAALLAELASSAGVDAALLQDRSRAVAIDVAMQSVGAFSTAVNAALLRVEAFSASIDAALLASGSAANSITVNAALRALEQVTALFGAAVQRSAGLTAVMNAGLAGVTSLTLSLDSLLAEERVLAAQIGALVEKALRQSAAADAALRDSATANASLDALLSLTDVLLIPRSARTAGAATGRSAIVGPDGRTIIVPSNPRRH